MLLFEVVTYDYFQGLLRLQNKLNCFKFADEWMLGNIITSFMAAAK